MYDASVRRPLIGIGLGLGLVAASGCFNPMPLPHGAPCTTDRQCLEGETCQAGFCEPPGYIGGTGVDSGVGTGSNVMPGDRDGDGVPDTSDNCPDVKNADQANDDGDARGNACDSCPFIADNGTDTDGDGLADLCDPDPMGTVHDAVWLQNDFAMALPASYAATSGWTATQGALHVADAGNTQNWFTIPLATTGRTFDHFALSVGFTVTSQSSSSNNEADLGFSLLDASSNREVDCVLAQGGGFPQGIAVFQLNPETDLPVNYAWTTATRYTLEVVTQLVGTQHQFSCNLFDAAHTLVKSTTGTFNVLPGGATIELWTDRMTAQLDWLFAAGKVP